MVSMLALFGSLARNAARDGSDVDIIIGFDGPATPDRYFDAPRSSTGYGTVLVGGDTKYAHSAEPFHGGMHGCTCL